MTTKIRRTEIQIETHEVTTIRGLSGQNSKYCEHCKTSVIGLTLDQAAPQFYSKIQASIARGDVHLVDESLVCSKSLDNQKTPLK